MDEEQQGRAGQADEGTIASHATAQKKMQLAVGGVGGVGGREGLGKKADCRRMAKEEKKDRRTQKNNTRTRNKKRNGQDAHRDGSCVGKGGGSHVVCSRALAARDMRENSW